MPVSTIIRRAKLQDISVIVPLWEEMMFFHAARDPHFQSSPNAKINFAKFLDESLKDIKKSALFVAELNMRIVGYCLCQLKDYPPVFVQEHYGEILDLAVTATFRNQGIGIKLVNAAKEWFTLNNIPRIELSLAITNEISTKFWRKVGFKPYMELMYKEIS
jgi:ribosomal protein S18 acetylase RimI-like enzyme